MKKIGLIYGSETGVTEEITTLIVDNWTVSDIHVMVTY
jgi:flavodoxin I